MIPRFSAYKENLKTFVSLRAFHTTYPACRQWTGSPVQPEDLKDTPPFGQESLDKLVTNVLTPMFNFKKHGSILAGAGMPPLELAFVKEVLPELEQLYKAEQAFAEPAAPLKKRTEGGETAGLPADSSDACAITAEEGRKLEAKAVKLRRHVVEEMAGEVFKSHVQLFTVGETALLDKIASLPMMSDGSTRMFLFFGGTQGAKDARKHQNPFKMIGAADEDNVNNFVDMYSRLSNPNDTAFWIAGRNRLLHNDLGKLLAALKPHVPMRQRFMHPAEQAFTALLRMGDTRSAMLDPTDMLWETKKKKTQKSKAGPRRFVPGNTAFVTMNELPVLAKEWRRLFGAFCGGWLASPRA